MRCEIKTIKLGFYEGDRDILEHLSRQPSKGRYIRDLIRKDMEIQVAWSSGASRRADRG